MIFIADPLYRMIKFPDEFRKIIDHEYMQRLRRVRQLGTAYLVYPSATHTRFEHSLGVGYLSGLIAESLGLEKEKYILTGLLHDIGHGPFSHVSEEILKFKFGISHEDISIKKIKEMKDIISELGFDYREIIDEIEGRGLGIVSGDLDADRLDYLQRDAYFTGNFTGLHNVLYIVYNFVLYENTIALKEKTLPLVEAILMTRITMYKTVYVHKTVVSSGLLIEKSIENLFDYYKPEEIYYMDDYELVSILRKYKDKYFEKFEKRNLPKLVFSENIYKFMEYNKKIYNEIYERLMEKFGDNVYIWPKKKPKVKWVKKLKIITNNGLKSIIELSRFVRSLVNLEKTIYNFRVYLDREIINEENINYIKKVIKDYIS